MDDKQKLFRLVKRLNTDPLRSTNNGTSDRGLQTPRARNSIASGKDSNVDSLEAKLRAQMLDGNAALLSLADDSDDYLLQVQAHTAAPSTSFAAWEQLFAFNIPWASGYFACEAHGRPYIFSRTGKRCLMSLEHYTAQALR